MSRPQAGPEIFNGDEHGQKRDSLIRRSWHAMSDMLSPFSSSALATLPNPQRPQRYTRTDAIPETDPDRDGQPLARDYHAINSIPSQVRVPKKIATTVKVEGKVWFANERTWISWLNLSVMIGTLALALFNASSDPIARTFAYVYALISVGVLIYGYMLYQQRITMILKRNPGHYDSIVGPVIVSALLFFAVLANFVIRVRELREKNIPIPGSDFIASFTRQWQRQTAYNTSMF